MGFLNTISLPLARPEGWDILPSFPSNLVTFNEPVKFIPPTVTGFMWCPECPPCPKSSFLPFRTRENLRSSSPAYFIKIGKTISDPVPAEMIPLLWRAGKLPEHTAVSVDKPSWVDIQAKDNIWVGNRCLGIAG